MPARQLYRAFYPKAMFAKIIDRQVFWLTALCSRLPITVLPVDSGIMTAASVPVKPERADYSYGNSSGFVPDSLLMYHRRSRGHNRV